MGDPAISNEAEKKVDIFTKLAELTHRRMTHCHAHPPVKTTMSIESKNH
jgi:hypothetical protein